MKNSLRKKKKTYLPKKLEKFSLWLERKWINPSYSGWLLLFIGLCFFGAATNTLSGWLYVISGIIGSLLIIGAILPIQSLKKLTINRLSITPVSAGDLLTIELDIENPTSKPKTLLEVEDILPYTLLESIQMPMTNKEKKKDLEVVESIELIEPYSVYRWVYYLTTTKRGVYLWHEIELKTANPLGICYCRRSREIPAKAIVYPQVLPLKQCPLVDSIGQDDSTKLQSERLYQSASQGITKGLRQYRRGDPTRLIHWRSSARLGELQVRELETITGGQEVIICLDSASSWETENFENAVIAAASIYFYASRCQLNAQLWSAGTGLIHGNRVVLEALAAIVAGEDSIGEEFPSLPLIWLTQNPVVDFLPSGSRWVLFSNNTMQISKISTNLSGLIIDSEHPLETELSKPIK